MTAIVHSICPSGIIVATDSQTTIKENNETYSISNTQKLFAKNNMVVSISGDNKINNQFIEDIINDLIDYCIPSLECPLILLNNIKRKCKNNENIVLLISFYYEQKGYVYRIETKNNTCALKLGEGSGNDFGATWSGSVNNQFSCLLNNVDYKNCNLKSLKSLILSSMIAILTSDSLKNNRTIDWPIQFAVLNRKGLVEKRIIYKEKYKHYLVYEDKF